MRRVAAVDLGATSARVAVVDLDGDDPEPEIVHRHAHQPVVAPDGTLRWDWDRLVAEVETGLHRARATGPLASIGIDTWGVDYGLLGDDGQLLSPPHAYRSDRTGGWGDVADRIGRDHLYRTTGIQLLPFNTIFQLAVHDRDELARAAALLLLPELLIHHLTGTIIGETTSAGTTGLVDLGSGTWSTELLDAVGVEQALMPPIARAGTQVGTWRDIPVHLVGGHDTASAVAARPPDPPEASVFVATGTWLLVGAERRQADTSDAARLGNYSNEPGALGGFRFLKNVTGLWLLERCRAAWGHPPVSDLVAALDGSPFDPAGPRVDPNAPRFANPIDMEAEIRAAAGLGSRAGRTDVVRCILDSLAAATADVVRDLARFLEGPVERVDVIGGGGRLRPLVDRIEAACDIEVVVGPAEATALGNARVQGIALG